MKNKTAISISKILLSIFPIPLYFVKLFHGVGHLPSESGEIVRVDFYHSMLENLELDYLAYISIALLVCSAVLATLELIFKDNRGIRIASNITFSVALVLFLILLLVASSVARGY